MLPSSRWWRFSSIAFCLGLAAAPLVARDFTAAVYNVENLFDVDGVSLFGDYEPPGYGPAQLARKLHNTAAVLRRFNDGAGPDIVLLCELEADQTPASAVPDMAAFLARWRGRSAQELLAARPLDPELAGAPAVAWLLKELEDEGLPSYHVALGTWRADPTHAVAHVNAVLSRFPIIAQRTHATVGARGILEVVVEIDGRRLYLFDNHWKSGASDPAMETVRIGNARVLRRRLDEILRSDPHADIVVGGDFNSQYDQKQRYPDLGRTAINDILGSQGDELALERDDGPDLYNLWFELPVEKRGSDVYHEEWGTLIQMLVTRGLYDRRGIQYVDNSFAVGAFVGLNAEPATRRPIRWSWADGGTGFSDHLPVVARFRTVGEEAGQVSTGWMPLKNPSRTRDGSGRAVPAHLPLATAVDLTAWPAGREFRTNENLGRLFRVHARVTGTRPFRARVVGSTGGEILLWLRTARAREAFFGAHAIGDRLQFIGELGRYRGEWQFVIVREE